MYTTVGGLPVTINIMNVNDNHPVFQEAEIYFNITESPGNETFYLLIEAIDDDYYYASGDNFGSIISYEFVLAPIENNPFVLLYDDVYEVARMTNAIPLDYDSGCYYHLVVAAVDGEVCDHLNMLIITSVLRVQLKGCLSLRTLLKHSISPRALFSLSRCQ